MVTSIKSNHPYNVWWLGECGHEWESTPYKRVIMNAHCPVCSVKVEAKETQKPIPVKIKVKTKSIKNGVKINDKLFAEIHPTLNELTAYDMTKNEVHPKRILWWACSEEGHVAKANIETRLEYGCPTCAMNSSSIKFLTENYPDYASEYHLSLNAKVTEKTISVSSLWWVCQEGHTWKRTIAKRVTRDESCLICSNVELLSGYNDMATVHPEWVRFWHPTLNGNLKPNDVLVSSNDMFWWQDRAGEVFKLRTKTKLFAAMVNYQSRDSNILKTIEDFWHSSKNGALLPSEVQLNTKVEVWCECTDGHEWFFDLSQPVTYFYAGCKECAVRSRMLDEWHPTLNGTLNPVDIIEEHPLAYIWWLCKEGHEFMLTPSQRSSQKTGTPTTCYVCSSQKIIKVGENDLFSLHPEVAALWHPTLNGDFTVEKAVVGLSYNFWWKHPECGHEWAAYPANTITHPVCRVCNVKNRWRVRTGVNDISTTHPALSAQWHPTKNGNLKPNDVQVSASIGQWLHCEQGHEWKLENISRNVSYPCAVCPHESNI